MVHYLISFGLKCLFFSCLVSVNAMEGEDSSQEACRRFFTVLYAGLIVLVWKVFRWLMGRLTFVAIPQFNRQMAENAELMVRLVLKHRGSYHSVIGKKSITP